MILSLRARMQVSENPYFRTYDAVPDFAIHIFLQKHLNTSFKNYFIQKLRISDLIKYW